MTDAIQTARELATHASDIAHLQSDMDKLVASVSKMQETLNGIERTLAEAKGGWRVLVAVGPHRFSIGIGWHSAGERSATAVGEGRYPGPISIDAR